MSRFQSALLGGLFIGVFSSLPLVGSANLCCCLWVVAGGLLTVYLLQQNHPGPIESTDAALQGLVAGAVGALINVAAVALLLGFGDGAAAFDERLRAMLEQNAQVPPDVRDRVANVFSSGFLPLLIAAVTVPTYAVFGMLGALLGAAIFKKKVPPSTPSV